MGGRKYSDITIRGKTYPTAQAAAKALGVSEVAVQRAVRLGVLDRCGLRITGPAPMKCRIMGRDFKTVKAAAAHYRVTPHAIYKALEDGDVDRIAIPQGPCMVRAKAIKIGPLSWPSHAAAERDLGLSPGYIGCARRRASKGAEQRILSAAMALLASRVSSPKKTGASRQ